MLKLKNKLPVAPNSVEFDSLKDNDTFLFEGELYVKTQLSIESGDQCAWSLSGSGRYVSDMCDTLVVPVDVELSWKRREIKSKSRTKK